MPDIPDLRSLVELNAKIYDELADDYNANWPRHKKVINQVLSHFLSVVESKFLEKPLRFLDVGCGVGLNLIVLREWGHNVTGIDVSSRMLGHARKNALGSKVVQSDFLEYCPKERFNGIIMMAFIHLFPSKDLPLLFSHLKELLLPDGCAIIITTIHEQQSEGFFEKVGYGHHAKRYRVCWEKNKLAEAIINNHFFILDEIITADSVFDEKKWVSFIITPEKN